MPHIADIITSFINDTVEYQRVLRRRLEEVEDKEFQGIIQKTRMTLLPARAVDRLERRLQSTESERATAISKVSNMELELEGKQKQILASGEKVADSLVVIENQAAKIAELELKISTTSEEVKAASDTVAILKKKEASHKEREVELQETIHQQATDLQQAGEAEAALNRTIRSLRESLRNANYLIKKLEDDVANATETTNLLEGSKKELEAQLETAAMQWADVKTTSEREVSTPPLKSIVTPEPVTVNSELLETIESQRVILQTAQDEVDDLIVELNNCREQNNQLTRERDQLQHEVSHLEQSTETLTTQLEQKQDRLTQAAADADFASGSAKRAEQNVAAMDAKIALLQGKVDALQEASLSKDEQLAAKEAVLSTITYSNDQNEVTIAQLEAQLSDTQPKYDMARAELENARDELVQKSSELHSQQRVIADLNRQLRLANGELETRTKTEKIYRTKADEYREDSEDIRVKMMSSQVAYEQDLTEVREALRSSKSDLHKQRLANSALTAKLRDTEAALDELSKEATDTVSILKDALTDAQTEITCLHKRYKLSDRIEPYVPSSAETPAKTSSNTWEPVPVTDLMISIPRTTHAVKPTPAPFSP